MMASAVTVMVSSGTTGRGLLLLSSDNVGGYLWVMLRGCVVQSMGTNTWSIPQLLFIGVRACSGRSGGRTRDC